MYHERLRLLSLHLIRCLYSSRVRKPVMGKLQKGETGRAPGPSEVLSKAFPFYALSRRYSSCQLIFILAKTWGLKRTFQLLRHTLQQDWVFFWKDREGGREKKVKTKKERRLETVGMERTSRRRGTEKNQIARLGKWGRMNMALCTAEKRNQTHTGCVDSGFSLCVLIPKINLTHHNKHVLRLPIYSQSSLPGSLSKDKWDRQRESATLVRSCVRVICAAAAAHQSTAFLLSTVVPRWDLKRKSLIKFDHHLFHLRDQCGPFRIFCVAKKKRKTFALVFSASSTPRLSKESWLHRWRSRVWRRWTLSSWILSFSPSMAKWINDVPPFNRRTPTITKGLFTHFEDT